MTEFGGWFTAADVAAVNHLAQPDERCSQVAAAVADLVQSYRPDLAGPDGIYRPTPRVFEAARIFARLAIRADISAGAVAQMDSLAVGTEDYGQRQTAFIMLGNPGPMVG
jgi:hypothetical protein